MEFQVNIVSDDVNFITSIQQFLNNLSLHSVVSRSGTIVGITGDFNEQTLYELLESCVQKG